MAKKKKRNSKKKHFKGLTKEARKEQGKLWVETYEGNDIVQAYSKIFGLNLENSMKELIAIGVHINSEEKERIQKKIEEKKRKKEEKERYRMLSEYDEYDDDFAFIAGYTEGGAPFGITYDEWEEIEGEEREPDVEGK